MNFENDLVIRPLLLNSGITDTTNNTFEWFEASNPTQSLGSDPTYLVNEADPEGDTRTYTVQVTSTSSNACTTTSAAFEVLQSGPAVVQEGTIGYVVSNAFSDLQTITVTIEGYGDYQYSLDDGPRQDSPIFSNVSLGSHIIYVWDTKGGEYSCETLGIENVQVIDLSLIHISEPTRPY